MKDKYKVLCPVCGNILNQGELDVISNDVKSALIICECGETMIILKPILK